MPLQHWLPQHQPKDVLRMKFGNLADATGASNAVQYLSLGSMESTSSYLDDVMNNVGSNSPKNTSPYSLFNGNAIGFVTNIYVFRGIGFPNPGILEASEVVEVIEMRFIPIRRRLYYHTMSSNESDPNTNTSTDDRWCPVKPQMFRLAR